MQRDQRKRLSGDRDGRNNAERLDDPSAPNLMTSGDRSSDGATLLLRAIGVQNFRCRFGLPAAISIETDRARDAAPLERTNHAEPQQPRLPVGPAMQHSGGTDVTVAHHR